MPNRAGFKMLEVFKNKQLDLKENESWLFLAVAFFTSVLILTSFFYSFDNHSRLSLTSDPAQIEFQHAYLITEQDNLSIADAMASNEFTPTSTELVPVSLGEQAYWHKFRVENHTAQLAPLTLLLDNYVISEIDIYTVKNEHIISAEFRGNSRWPKELEQRALPSLNFELMPEEDITFYIRVKSKGSAHLPLVMFYNDDFNNYKYYIFLLWGTLIGLVFIIAFYNSILFFGERDVVYLYYVGYILSILLEMGLLHGFLIFMLPTTAIDLLTEHISSVHYLIVFFGLMFALKYLKFDQDKSKVYKYGIIIALCFIPLAIFTLFIKEHIGAQIYFTVQACVYVFITYLLVLKYKENFSWAKYYFVSWLPIYIGGVITPMFFMGFIEYSFWTRNALLIGVMAEAALISMGLASRLRSNEQQILYQSTHDQTLGLANTALMSRIVNNRKKAEPNTFRYSIAVIEITNFHTFSPYLTTGQIKKLIFQVIDLIQSAARGLKLLKIGSPQAYVSEVFIIKDGFLGICIQSADAKKIEVTLSKLEKSLPITFSTKKMSLEVNCVIGYALSKDGRHAMQITNKALQAIILAKKQGKVCAEFKQTLVKNEQRRILLASDLKSAINNNELSLHYQPQLSISSGAVKGTEVLLRWHHKRLGFIPPDEFIQIAEDTGLIDKITQWVITHAFVDHLTLTQVHPNFTTSINVSVLDIVNSQLCKFIIEQAKKTGVMADRIILEVTETASIEDEGKFKRNLKQLAEFGFIIAIDDYGTGYSSLNYLSENPIRELKIDKSLINDFTVSKKNELIVESTLKMAKSLDIAVVAEGIEDQATLDKLKSFNCEIGQGYFFSKPVPFKELMAFITN